MSIDEDPRATIAIRPAAAADVPVLQAIDRRTISACYRSFLGDAAVDGFLASGEPDRYVEAHIDRCTVIAVDGRIAGLCVCEDNRIDLLMIDHDRHRGGLGTRLLAHCEARLFEHFDVLVVRSFKPNERADRFYRKNGWTERSIDFDEQAGVNMVTFVKRRSSISDDRPVGRAPR